MKYKREPGKGMQDQAEQLSKSRKKFLATMYNHLFRVLCKAFTQTRLHTKWPK